MTPGRRGVGQRLEHYHDCGRVIAGINPRAKTTNWPSHTSRVHFTLVKCDRVCGTTPSWCVQTKTRGSRNLWQLAEGWITALRDKASRCSPRSYICEHSRRLHTDRPTKYLSISKERARESNELSQRSEGGERRALEETCRKRALRTTEPAARRAARRGGSRGRRGAREPTAEERRRRRWLSSALNFRQIYHRSLAALACARKLFLQRGFAARDLLRKVSINRAEFALSNCASAMTNDIANAPKTNFFCAQLSWV